MSDNSKLKDNRDLSLTKRKKKGDPKPSNEIDNNAILMANKESIKIFIQMIELNVNFFWPEHKIDENFINLFIKTGFDMLENPNNIKNQEIKNILFDMMQKCMQKFGGEMKYMLTQNTQKIIHLLYNQDNLAKPLSEFVGLVADRQDNTLANEIIRDLTKEIFHNDSQHETIGIKNVAKFLSKLSKQAPKAVYLNIGNLLGFFDCEAYLLRQALIKILSNTIQKVLCAE